MASGELGASAAAAAAPGGTKLWSYSTGYRIDHSSPALSPDGKVLYIGPSNPHVDIPAIAIETASGTNLWNFTAPAGDTSSGSSPTVSL